MKPAICPLPHKSIKVKYNLSGPITFNSLDNTIPSPEFNINNNQWKKNVHLWKLMGEAQD